MGFCRVFILLNYKVVRILASFLQREAPERLTT